MTFQTTLTDLRYNQSRKMKNKEGRKATLQDIFGEELGDMLSGANSVHLYLGQEVVAKTGAFSVIIGRLVSMPTETVPYCIIDGTITSNGQTRADRHLFAPEHLVKPSNR